MNKLQRLIVKLLGLEGYLQTQVKDRVQHEVKEYIKWELDRHIEANSYMRGHINKAVENAVNRIQDGEIREEVRKEINRITSPEQFLDEVVIRLKKKQLD